MSVSSNDRAFEAITYVAVGEKMHVCVRHSNILVLIMSRGEWIMLVTRRESVWIK